MSHAKARKVSERACPAQHTASSFSSSLLYSSFALGGAWRENSGLNMSHAKAPRRKGLGRGTPGTTYGIFLLFSPLYSSFAPGAWRGNSGLNMSHAKAPRRKGLGTGMPGKTYGIFFSSVLFLCALAHLAWKFRPEYVSRQGAKVSERACPAKHTASSSLLYSSFALGALAWKFRPEYVSRQGAKAQRSRKGHARHNIRHLPSLLSPILSLCASRLRVRQFGVGEGKKERETRLFADAAGG